MFLLHVNLERFLPVENFFALFTVSSSYSLLYYSFWIVVHFEVFFKIVVALGSIWTKRTEEPWFCHVRVHVGTEQCFLLEELLAQITDKWILVGRRPSLTLFLFVITDWLPVDFPPMVELVVQLAEFTSTEEDCATAANEELVID